LRIREGQLDAAEARPYLAEGAEIARAASTAPPADPYLGLERRLRVPLLRLGDRLFEPLIAFLSRRGVSPHAVSGLQVLLAASAFYALPRWPRGTLLLWLTALTTDGVDGMLARRSRRASSFGMLWDQTCDHAREALVVASLAHYGLVAPLWAVFYAFAYPALNVVLYLANRYAVPLPLAPRHYLTFYPALIAYLACGTDLLTPALALATAGMAAGCGVALWRLHRVMP
jgi:phosphatidylglycerophosphate synthase